jgi:hypothetical protein
MARQLSASDLDNPRTDPDLQRELFEERPPGAGVSQVFTSDGYKPYIADGPAEIQSDETPLADNPLNPKGQPSLSYPQQTTPLTSAQGVISGEDLANRETMEALLVGDGAIPDNPLNPKGSPDFLVAPQPLPAQEALRQQQGEQPQGEQHG